MKRILLIIAISLLAFTAMAQIKVLYGVSGGLNLSGLLSDNYEEIQRKTGCYLGLWSEFPITPLFSVQAELLYATYGADVIVHGIPFSWETEYDLDYIQLPVLGNFNIHERFFFEFGAAFNLLVREKGYRPGLPDVIEADGTVRSQSVIDPNGKRFEISALAGLSYEINPTWKLSVRYTRGLTRTFDYPGDYNVTRNDAIQIGIRCAVEMEH